MARVSKRIIYCPLGVAEGIVDVQEEFCAIIWPSPHWPLATVPERSPASSILNQLRDAGSEVVQSPPQFCNILERTQSHVICQI